MSKIVLQSKEEGQLQITVKNEKKATLFPERPLAKSSGEEGKSVRQFRLS
jgi:hypothetical protein